MSDEIKEDEEEVKPGFVHYTECTRCERDPKDMPEMKRMQSEGLCDKCMGEV